MGKKVYLNIINSYMVSVWQRHKQYPKNDLLLYYNEKVTILINAFIETNRFLLNINILNIIFFCKWSFLLFNLAVYCILLCFNLNITPVCQFLFEHILKHYLEKNGFKLFVLVTYHWIWIHYHAFIILFFVAYHAHFLY